MVYNLNMIVAKVTGRRSGAPGRAKKDCVRCDPGRDDHIFRNNGKE